MQSKDRLRKKYFLRRKKNYFDTKPNFFNPLIKIIKKNIKKILLTYQVITQHLSK